MYQRILLVKLIGKNFGNHFTKLQNGGRIVVAEEKQKNLFYIAS